MTIHITGYCPMGCGETLILIDGEVTCSRPQCAEREAVSMLLADGEIAPLLAQLARLRRVELKHYICDQYIPQLEELLGRPWGV